MEHTGTCEHCAGAFTYRLVHNGFSDTAYGYCVSCGCTAQLSGWFDQIPHKAALKLHEPITPQTEALLRPCECGGLFSGTAAPRCPHCKQELSAERSRPWIETNARGTAKGWPWQNSWSGIYSIVIEENRASDPWAQES